MTTVLDPPVQFSARTDRGIPRVVRKFRPDIEGLRAVAVTIVVLSHLGLGFPGGYVGVDVFFVISGFLITRQLMGELTRSSRISFRGFYARRIRRILPAATVVIVGTILACWKWDSPLRVKTDARDGLFSAFSGVNWRLAVNGTNYFQSTLPPSPFQHFWSLAVEEQFYAVWPLLLMLVSLIGARRFGRRASVVWTLLAIMAASLYLSATTTASSPSWAYFGTQTRAWELALGALIAVTVDVWTRMPPALASQMSWLGLGMIALSVFMYGPSTNYPGVAVVLPVLGSGMVIAGGCPGWSRSSELVLKQAPMQFLGKTSYSWYLVHWPVLTILPLALGHALTTAEKWEVLVLSLALAVVMYYVVEQPARTRSWLVSMPRYSMAFGGVLVLVSVGTAAAVTENVTVPGGGGGHVVIAQDTADLSVIEHAVTVGASLKSLPANVDPPLTKASTDRPSTTKCLQADTLTTPFPNVKCSFGDLAATRTIAVVGDSHANSWMPAIDAFASANGFKTVLYAKAGCPPGVYTSDVDPITNRLYTQCNTWRTEVFSRLASLRPSYVIVTAELRTLDIDPSGEVQAIKSYQAAGAHVIYLEDTPNPNNIGAVPDCLAKHTSDIQACSLPRRAPTTRLEGMVQRKVEATAAQQAGATLLDPTDWFCTTTTCPPVINNMIVYADNSHTTATYVTWLAPIMSAALKKIIG